MSKIIYITEKDFDNQLLKHAGYSIVEAFQDSTVFSIIMEPIFKRLQTDFNIPFNHFRINLEKYPFVIEKFYVLHDHCFLFFYNGNLIDRINGLVSFNELYEKVNLHLKTINHNG